MCFMRVLVINADCLTRNSSANLCHLSYLRGLIENGFEVDVLSADGKDYQLDPAMVIPKEVTNYTIYGVSLYEKASMIKSRQAEQVVEENQMKGNDTDHVGFAKFNSFLKRIILSLYGPHGIYRTFIRKAITFSSSNRYDLLLSISTPPASHLLAYKLLKKGNIQAKRWIQIWEDPWFSDAYGFSAKKAILKEEKRLLTVADKICYVSPLTLKNQQVLFPESAKKMFWEPLPSYYQNNNLENAVEGYHFGYFGDYAPEARDLRPFYEAAKAKKINVEICGNPSNLFEATDKINIYPRLPLDELKYIEDKTNVLIFLCNKKGGQIPGKIYQYAATSKKILFILDGTADEKEVLYEYFSQFHRFLFCENNVDSIGKAIERVLNSDTVGIDDIPLNDFSSGKIIQRIIRHMEK